MQFIAYAKTDKGMAEPVNEDSIAYFSKSQNHEKAFLMLVCDGVGGLSYGELASRCLVQEFYRWFSLLNEELFRRKKWQERIIEEWRNLLIKANQKLKSAGKKLLCNLGTTLSVLFIYKDTYLLFHVGDSRVYKINHFVQLISKDHTLYEKRKQEPFYALTKNKEKEKHVLTQCVGVTLRIQPYIKVGKLKKNTSFLVCSDGFYQKLTKKEMKKFFSPRNCKRKEKLRYGLLRCIQLVKERKEMDNISAAVVICR